MPCAIPNSSISGGGKPYEFIYTNFWPINSLKLLLRTLIFPLYPLSPLKKKRKEKK